MDVNYLGVLKCWNLCKINNVDKFIYMSCAGNSNATKEALELKWKAEKELLELNDNRITVIKPGHVFCKEVFLSYLRGIYYRHKWSKNSNVPPLYHVFIYLSNNLLYK